MSLTNRVLDVVPTFVLGATLVLTIGVLAMIVSRSLIQRKRFASTTLLVFLGWCALAALPIPRPWANLPGDGVRPIPPTVGATIESPIPDPDLVAAPATPPVAPAVALSPPIEIAAVPADEPSRDANLLDVAAFSLLLGSVISLAYLALAWTVLRRRVARMRVAPEFVRRLATSAGFKIPRLRILLSDANTRPYCFGLRVPTIVLPGELCQPECRDRLQAVLLHELCHIRGKDLHDQLLLALSLPLLYWHPLFWFLQNRLRLASEMLADEGATQMLDRKTYVRELIELTHLPNRPLPLVPAVSVVGRQSEFYRRMNMLLQRTRPLSTTCSRAQTAIRRAAAALLLTSMTLSLGMGMLSAQDKPSAAPAVETKSDGGSHRYVITGTYPTAPHLETMLLGLARNGFATTKLNFRTETGKGRAFTLQMSTPIRTRKQGRTAQSRVHDLTTELRDAGIVIERLAVLPPQQARPTRQAIESKLITIDHDQADVRSVFREIGDTAEISIAIAPEVRGKVTLRLRNVPWRDAMKTVCRTIGNTVIEEEHGVVRIMPRRKASPIAKAPRVYFAFKNAPLQQVIDTIAKISGANIVVSPKVKGNVTLRLRNIPWQIALEAACKTLGHKVTEGKRGIWYVTAGDE